MKKSVRSSLFLIILTCASMHGMEIISPDASPLTKALVNDYTLIKEIKKRMIEFSALYQPRSLKDICFRLIIKNKLSLEELPQNLQASITEDLEYQKNNPNCSSSFSPTKTRGKRFISLTGSSKAKKKLKYDRF